MKKKHQKYEKIAKKKIEQKRKKDTNLFEIFVKIAKISHFMEFILLFLE